MKTHGVTVTTEKNSYIISSSCLIPPTLSRWRKLEALHLPTSAPVISPNLFFGLTQPADVCAILAGPTSASACGIFDKLASLSTPPFGFLIYLSGCFLFHAALKILCYASHIQAAEAAGTINLSFPSISINQCILADKKKGKAGEKKYSQTAKV